MPSGRRGVAQRRCITRSAVRYARGAVRRGGAGSGVGGARAAAAPGRGGGEATARCEAALCPPPRAGRRGKTFKAWCPAKGCEDMLKEWDDPAKAPHEVTRASSEKVWWRCGRKIVAPVGNRTRGGGCPACAGRVPTATHNLAVWCGANGRDDMLRKWAHSDKAPTDNYKREGVGARDVSFFIGYRWIRSPKAVLTSHHVFVSTHKTWGAHNNATAGTSEEPVQPARHKRRVTSGHGSVFLRFRRGTRRACLKLDNTLQAGLFDSSDCQYGGSRGVGWLGKRSFAMWRAQERGQARGDALRASLRRVWGGRYRWRHSAAEDERCAEAATLSIVVIGGEVVQVEPQVERLGSALSHPLLSPPSLLSAHLFPSPPAPHLSLSSHPPLIPPLPSPPPRLLKYPEMLSSLVFNINLRRYAVVRAAAARGDGVQTGRFTGLHGVDHGQSEDMIVGSVAAAEPASCALASLPLAASSSPFAASSSPVASSIHTAAISPAAEPTPSALASSAVASAADPTSSEPAPTADSTAVAKPAAATEPHSFALQLVLRGFQSIFHLSHRIAALPMPTALSSHKRSCKLDGESPLLLGGAIGTVAAAGFSTAFADLSGNLVFMSAFLSWLMAQLMKIVTTFYKEGRWDWRVMLDSGGMPSSHTALVVGLTTGIAYQYGLGSTLFPLVGRCRLTLSKPVLKPPLVLVSVLEATI